MTTIRELTPPERLQATMRDFLEMLERLPALKQLEILAFMETYIRERRADLTPNNQANRTNPRSG